MPLQIRSDDLAGPQIRALIAAHLSSMGDHSPEDSCHALDADRLRHPSITVWTAWIDEELAGMGALKQLDGARGEIKSMRVDDRFRGAGVGRAILRHIMATASARGMTSLWLETGASGAFAAAQRLYVSEGFVECEPFDEYRHDVHSVFMTRAL